MFDEGVLKLDDNGQYQAVMNPAEREHIKRQVTESKRKSARGLLTTVFID